jgi:simple sugar transport system ATP-binding protein
MIVGRDVLLRVEKDDAKPGAAVLTVSDLRVAGRQGHGVVGVSFEVRAGEIVGIAASKVTDKRS